MNGPKDAISRNHIKMLITPKEVWNGSLNLLGVSVQIQYAFQRNDRQEAEPSRIPDAEPQYNFLLRTHSTELFVDHTDWMIGKAELDIEWGASAKHQDNLYAGRMLIPNYRQFDLGGFWTNRLDF